MRIVAVILAGVLASATALAQRVCRLRLNLLLMHRQTPRL